MRKFGFILLSFSLSFFMMNTVLLSQQATDSYRSYVVKKNGERVYGAVRIPENSPLGFGTTVLVDDSIKLTFQNFDSLRINHQQFILHREVLHNRSGTKYKYQFLKRLNGGALPIYARVTSQSEMLTKKSYDFFMTADSSFQRVNYSNLAEILHRESESSTILKKAEKFHRWSNISLAIGGAALIYGIFNSGFISGYKRDPGQQYMRTIVPDFNIGVFVGLGFIVNTAVLRGVSKKYFKRSIERYNE